jgi:hypothetical protein
MMNLKPCPSPFGSNKENLFLVCLPRRGRGADRLALDAAIDPERVEESIFEQLSRLATEAETN